MAPPVPISRTATDAGVVATEHARPSSLWLRPIIRRIRLRSTATYLQYHVIGLTPMVVGLSQSLELEQSPGFHQGPVSQH